MGGGGGGGGGNLMGGDQEVRGYGWGLLGGGQVMEGRSTILPPSYPLINPRPLEGRFSLL